MSRHTEQPASRSIEIAEKGPAEYARLLAVWRGTCAELAEAKSVIASQKQAIRELQDALINAGLGE